VQTHEAHDNSLAPRTIGALVLHPTGNEHGGQYFYSLSTGHHINRYSWTTLPMLEEVIGRVHELAMSNSADVDNGNDAILDYDD